MSEQTFRHWSGNKAERGGDGREPAAIFLCSDGVDDSYPVYENEKYLERLYRLIVLIFYDNDFDAAYKQIEDYLPTLSRRGSGDDMSMAGIVGEINGKLAEYLRALDEAQKLDDKLTGEPENGGLRDEIASAKQKSFEKREELMDFLDRRKETERGFYEMR
jgi:hypothetical protein